MLAAFGPEPRMQAYGRGIRRRLAPMLGGDHRRISMAHSLLLSLPGTPMIRHGEEIGMGDDLSLPERLSVRTPMQWSGEENAGFSTAPAKQLIRPVITGGEYGYEQVNVGRQSHDPESLMNRFERLVRARKNNPEFARGQAELLETGDDAVFAHRSSWRDGVVIACHNLADRPARVSLSSALSGARLIDLIDRKDDEAIDPARIVLPPYGYRWFRARK